MNTKNLLKIFLLVVLLFAFVSATEEDGEKESKAVEAGSPTKEDDASDKAVDTKADDDKNDDEEKKEEPKKEEPKKEEPKTTVKPTTTQSKPTPTPQKTQQQTQQQPQKNNTQKQTTPAQQAQPAQQKAAPVQQQKSTSSSSNTSSNNSSSNNSTSQKSNSNAAPAAANKASATVAAAAAATTPVVSANGNAVVPQVNTAQQANVATTENANVNADGNVENKKEGGSHAAVTGTVISLVAVGAVAGVAAGVNVYKKRNNEESSRGVELADIEAQPINTDFGAPMAPEDYNPYNIMNDAQNEYITNNPYEYKPNYGDDEMTTTPFQKTEAAQDNFMSRESIFSNSGNIPQIGNDVFNFGDNAQLPYVQELPVENSYIEEPVKNEIQVENYEMPNSQMPTLVPVQPEIVITQPEEEPAQEGYKQIVPNVAQMEIIETPDFNNMTTSMIEDHINNMDLENLANTETQPTNNEETDGGYKQIVPDIQEAVIENFEIDDDEEDPDMSVVDNITDTYRAALRATYCSTNDDNRFSYRTVDSDHSLLHQMREDGEW